MAIIALVPARGGSKGIPKKNIKLLAGRPLLHWATSAALDCSLIDRVVVSSDSEEVLAVARSLKHEKLVALKRNPALASDDTSTESVMLDFVAHHPCETLVLLQPTSPLTTSSDLTQALRRFEDEALDSLVTVTRQHRFRWQDRGDGTVEALNYDPAARPRRQDWDGELAENGAFYITRVNRLVASGSRLSGRIGVWEMPAETAIELDESIDWAVLESLLRRRRALLGSDITARCRSIRLLVTDVDGVLTDGGMYYDADGERLKRFNTRDGMGLARWREAGGHVAIVTGERFGAVASRAKKLGIDQVFLGVSNKLETVRTLASRLGLDLSEVAMIGDDLNDLEALRSAGVSAAPADAEPLVVENVDFRCSRAGGKGCVREFVDFLAAQGAPSDAG